MNAYVDSFKSKYVQAYFDVGNIVFYAYPQDWIRTLGPRIKKVHLKDFKLERSKGTFNFVHLGEGDIDWPEVRKALHDIGYNGYVTTEIQRRRQGVPDRRGRADRPVPGRSAAGGQGRAVGLDHARRHVTAAPPRTAARAPRHPARRAFSSRRKGAAACAPWPPAGWWRRMCGAGERSSCGGHRTPSRRS